DAGRGVRVAVRKLFADAGGAVAGEQDLEAVLLQGVAVAADDLQAGAIGGHTVLELRHLAFQALGFRPPVLFPDRPERPTAFVEVRDLVLEHVRALEARHQRVILRGVLGQRSTPRQHDDDQYEKKTQDHRHPLEASMSIETDRIARYEWVQFPTSKEPGTCQR